MGRAVGKIALISAFLFAVTCSNAFQLSSSLFSTSHRISRRSPYTIVAASDKEKEIAELEEKLAQLKSEPNLSEGDEKIVSVVDDDGEEVILPQEMTEPEDAFDMNAYRKRVANIKEQPPAEFLTEAWKESLDDSPGLGASLKLAGLVVAAVVLLVAFSQVPIGEDGLVKYSAKIGL